jgi:hypothetical protein
MYIFITVPLNDAHPNGALLTVQRDGEPLDYRGAVFLVPADFLDLSPAELFERYFEPSLSSLIGNLREALGKPPIAEEPPLNGSYDSPQAALEAAKIALGDKGLHLGPACGWDTRSTH